jgi:hypothetical protein
MLRKRLNCLTGQSVTTVALILLGLGVTARPAKSVVFALQDNNSQIAFESASNPNNPNPTNTGILFWNVDNTQQLFQSELWYRVGSTGPENSISSLTSVVTQPQPRANSLTATYTGTGFNLSRAFTLNGGAPGSGSSSLLETIAIQNTTASPLDFHLFNYSDFDLNQDGSDDTTTIGNGRATVSDNTLVAQETVTPVSNSYQVAPIFDLVNSLSDTGTTNLTNVPGHLNGDTNYAFQFDLTLAPGQSFLITDTKSLVPVPEPPATVSLIVFGGLMLFWRLRPNQAKSKLKI